MQNYPANGIFSNPSSMCCGGRCTAGAVAGAVDMAEGNSCERDTVCGISPRRGSTGELQDDLKKK